VPSVTAGSQPSLLPSLVLLAHAARMVRVIGTPVSSPMPCWRFTPPRPASAAAVRGQDQTCLPLLETARQALSAASSELLAGAVGQVTAKGESRHGHRLTRAEDPLGQRLLKLFDSGVFSAACLGPLRRGQFGPAGPVATSVGPTKTGAGTSCNLPGQMSRLR
jgi:hypothetical protein